jgi:hypothetical protein
MLLKCSVEGVIFNGMGMRKLKRPTTVITGNFTKSRTQFGE